MTALGHMFAERVLLRQTRATHALKTNQRKLWSTLLCFAAAATAVAAAAAAAAGAGTVAAPPLPPPTPAPAPFLPTPGVG